MEKRLTAFIESINMERLTGPPDPMITGLYYDSRRVAPGGLFFALPGLHTDGKKYIDNAIKKGARGVVYEGKYQHFHPRISYIQVPDCRKAMSSLSAAFYENPSGSIHIVGVTGTDGKSTTVYLTYQLYRLAGKSTGFLSTVSFNTGKKTSSNFLRQSTPEAPEIHGLLREMVENGMEYAVVEATSHGLSPKTRRLEDVSFSTGIFTNITHEHLEFHGTFQQYRNDKSLLFRSVSSAIINRDDENADFFISAAAAAGASVFTYTMDPKREADFTRLSYTETDREIRFVFAYNGSNYTARVPFIGLFNLENFAAAFLAVQTSTGCDPALIAESASMLRPVEGRMNVVPSAHPFRVIVDYAHTPGAFSTVLPLLRRHTKGKLIAVFGSAGERDIEKRSLQGEIADRYCDFIVLADEDPRGEDPMSILLEIAEGCTNKQKGETLFTIPDRLDAIRKAFSLAGPGDTVALLGKGHEKSIIYKNGAVEWDEIRAAEECLRDFRTVPDGGEKD